MYKIETKEALDEAKVAEVGIAAIPAAIIISAIVWLVMLAGMSILAVSR